MSNILNIKNLDGDWDSIVAIRGKQGEPGADGTQFEVNARFAPGNNVVPIADFITDKGTSKETTHTIYAPKGEGGGATVEYTDLHTFTDTKTIGRIDIDGESTNIVIPAKVSEFDNDVEYVYRGITQRVHTPLVVENGEVHNARTSIDGWASNILLVFNTDFSGDYIDIYKDEGESHPVARMPLKYGDGTKASFKAGEFCEVALSDEFSDYHSDEFVVLSRSYSKLSQFEDDKQYINFPKFLASMYDLGRETFAREYNAGDSYEVGDYVSNVEATSGSIYCAIYKCISPISSGTFISINNTDYWEQVLITDEIKNSGGGNTEKYMPGDVVYAGIIELYSASTGSSGVYILDKEVDESVSSISVEVDPRAYSQSQQNPQYTMRGAGKTVSAPAIDVTVDDLNRKRLDLKTSEKTTSNYLNIVSWVKFVFS